MKFWYVHLHNNLLNVAYQTGIIGAIVYSSSFISLIPFTNKYKTNIICKLLTFTIFIFLIMLLVDTYDLYGHFYVFGVIIANLSLIVNENSSSKYI